MYRSTKLLEILKVEYGSKRLGNISLLILSIGYKVGLFALTQQ